MISIFAAGVEIVEITYIEHTMFLCEHKSIQEFAQHFVSAQQENKHQYWSVICERNEDLQSIQNQLYFAISPNASTIAGISMYTLDQLAENFSATLAASQNIKLSQDFPPFLKKPYLKVEIQEQVLETILNIHGYIGADSSTLAKQILSLLDVEWPVGMNFTDLTLENQKKNNINTFDLFNETPLKQIIDTYEYAKNEFKIFNRLQSFVSKYLQEKFTEHLLDDELRDEMVLPKFLSGNILWVCAPEYALRGNYNEVVNKFDYYFVKPGSFQSAIVNSLQKAILDARKIMGYEENSVFFNAKTLLKNTYEDSDFEKDIKYYVAKSRKSFFDLTQNFQTVPQNLFICGDFDASKYQDMRSDAGGDFSLLPKDILAWEKKDENYLNATEAYPQIDELYDHFIEKISLLKPMNDAFLYQLFLKQMENKKIKIGDKHPVSNLPRGLSFLASEILPDKLIIIGKPNISGTSSFFTKIINNIFLVLRKNGVSIDLFENEMMQHGFWKEIVNQSQSVEFWLESSDEIEVFPQYLKPKNNIYSFGDPLPSLPISHLQKRLASGSLLIENWYKIFSWQKDDNPLHISVTQFERYVTCPLQFFLIDVLGIAKENKESFKMDHMRIGSQMHTIAEELITRLVTLLGNIGYAEEMPAIYNSILIELNNEANFLSLEKENWIRIFTKAIERTHHAQTHLLKIAFFEAIENLWTSFDKDKSYFEGVQEREIVKRTFLRFLQIEKYSIEENPKKATGIKREFPLEFNLNNITIYGKLDRIDQTQNELHIIDYKTSKIPKTNKSLSLLPSECKNTSESQRKLSVQGGLYCLGWAEKNYEAMETELPQKIKSFSLYRLKNLDEKKDPILKFEFLVPLTKYDDNYQKLRQEYGRYADKLLDGNFYPDPVQKSTCDFCDFNQLCPMANIITNKDTGQNDQ